jgi:maltooligosyltrehalose trehalohydrolase
MPTELRRHAGAISEGGDAIRWRVWAPRVTRVDLLLHGHASHGIRMTPESFGYFSHVEPDVPEGQLYAYSFGEGERADPCSLHQPNGVTGPSAVVRPERFPWTDADWKGIPREDLVIYELHVGTFTPEGTFDAIIPRLADLKDLGVTALEIMPVNQFPGNRNWGYDGVLPYATQDTYGGPHGLARLVDACHAIGLAVILDVVYNHMGPESNYLGEFGPYFTDKYKTPWGAAVNYDDAHSDPVRRFVIENAWMWLAEFHLDGLRLDAVHAIYDFGAIHLLREIQQAADAVSAASGWRRHVIAESDLNDPRVILPPERGGHGLGGQWADDFHHAVHAFLTGERRGYYHDYGSPQLLATVMQSPFFGAGEYSPHRRRRHGAPLPPEVGGDQFVVCVQNHDQVGNRAVGDRLGTIVNDPAKQRLAASLLLLAPYVPLLFMGEEYGETRPFPFFCSFASEELNQAVREGRKREFADFLGSGEGVPLPDAVETFESAKLTWAWPDGTVHGGLRHLYRDLLHARRSWPALRDYHTRAAELLPGGRVLQLSRGRDGFTAWFNLGETPQPLPRQFAGGGEAIRFSSESTRYGGSRHDLSVSELLPFECVAVGAPLGGS